MSRTDIGREFPSLRFRGLTTKASDYFVETRLSRVLHICTVLQQHLIRTTELLIFTST